MWGTGVNRFTLDVVLDDPSKVFPGLSPDQIKQRIVESVRAGSYDEVIEEAGDAGVFRRESPVYATATALVKGRILVVRLDGAFAGERKDDLEGLLKKAAARL